MGSPTARIDLSRIVPSAVGIAVLTLVAAVMVLPFLWIFQAAFAASDALLYQIPPRLFPADSTTANFGDVFNLVPFGTFILNSLIVAGAITFGQLVACSTAAYAFARMDFKGRRALFAVLLASLLVPFQVTIVPLFLLIRGIGAYNTLPALILPALVSAFGVFLLRQHFLSIPIELDEAAEIDGADRWTIFTRVVLPLSKPALATLGILTFTYWWNDVFTPLIMISDTDKQTLPVGLILLAGRYNTGSLGDIAAGITMAVVPAMIVFLIFQRYIVKSITSTGLKF
jgi:multiple sugar transport system permease protein